MAKIMVKKRKGNIFSKLKSLVDLVFSTSGYVLVHANLARTLVMLSAVLFTLYLGFYQALNFNLAIVYYVVSVTLYIGFITLVLRQDGYSKYFIKKWGAKKGYLIYEGILGFLFFNNGASIFYVASSTPGVLFDFIDRELLVAIASLLFIFGFVIKLWAAKVVSINIYYWKDMFLGKKICKFIVTGPYKYFSNPMYGVGQLHAYAVAIFYGSIQGLIAAAIYQSLVFTFYFNVEKSFIKRIYLKKSNSSKK